jgi:uncharacterized membrane protein YkoI
MEKTTKILIIICVVLIAAFSLTIGLLLGNHLNTPLVVNNSTNLSVNNTTTNPIQSNNTQNSTPEGNVLISPAEAETIANNNVQSQGLSAIGARLVNGLKSEYYQVTLARTNNLTISVAYCDVDATTGEYLGAYT